MSATSRLEFVDTNVLIYAYDKTAGERHHLARALVAELWRSRRGCISIQVLQEFYVVGQRRLTGVDLVALRELTADLTLWRVHAPQAGDMLAAVDLHRRHQIAFWDAMILQSAARLGCPVVWSEDLNSGQRYHDVRVSNPFVPGS